MTYGFASFSRATPEEQQRRHAMYDAAKKCNRCTKCLTAIEPHAPVWRQTVQIPNWKELVGPVCEACARGRFWTPQPCEFCKRPVADPAYRQPRARVFCCEMCASRAASRSAKARRTEARANIRCETCGEPFEAPRIDAKFCSPACRQKAWRLRVTALKSVTVETFATRNGEETQ